MSTTRTGIEWCDRTWNPVRGCSRISEGCRNCYAERVAARFCGAEEIRDAGRIVDVIDRQPFYGFARRGPNGARWTGKVELVTDALDAPLRWRKPARIFVNSMSDLFHEGLADDDIAAVFGVMAAAPQHTFLVLTKRAERMRRWFEWVSGGEVPPAQVCAQATGGRCPPPPVNRKSDGEWPPPWPIPNVWLGVSVEDQATADARIPHLLATPAAIRFCSYEPALGPVDFGLTRRADEVCGLAAGSRPGYVRDFLQWVIVGGESGPGARPFDVAWARSAVEQCKAAGVACFVKQLGAYPILDPRYDRSISGATRRLRDRKGGDPDEWPEGLRVREFPGGAT